MEKNNTPNWYNTQEPEGIDTRQLFSKILRKWYWFLLFGILGIGAGFVYHKYAQPSYKISSTILVKTDTKEGALMSMFQDLDLGSKSPNLQNQIGILKSFSLNLKALQNLNWDASWYEQSLFSKIDLYEREPFEVIQPEGSFQMKMLPVHITPISAEIYKIKIEGEQVIGAVQQEIRFEGQSAFGKPFKNEYFSFTINKIEGRPVAIGKEYILIFNDLSQLALDYQKKLQIKLNDEESDLIYVELESSQPVRAVNYLNELEDVYIQFGLNEKNRMANNTVKFIDNQIAGVTESLKSAGQNFTDFRSRNRIVDLGQEGGLVMEKLEEIENAETLSKMKLEYYNNLRGYLKDAGQMEDLVAPSVVGVTDPSLNALVLKLSELYSQREVLSYTAQEINPALVSLDREINYTQKILEENINNLVSNTQLELQNLSDRKQKVNNQLAKLPKTEQDLINIKRTFDLNNELYTFLLQRRAEAGIAKASNEPEAQILDPARLDTAIKLDPGKSRVALIGLVAGLILPLIIIMATDYFNNRIQSQEEVEKKTQLPVVASIAHNHYSNEFPVMEYPRSGISESFRSLRTNLQYLLTHHNQKVIAVHSIMAGEGKSFTSLNLASILAMNNHKVLLVGTDLRKPRLHNILSCGNGKGLTTYLINQDSFEEILSDTRIKNLSFVSSGPIPPNPAELLGNGEFEKFIQEARERYDYIVLDNSPVSMVTDGILAGQHADANLFILRQRYSHKEQLKFINQIAEQGIIKKIVLVLNDVKANGYSSKYNSYAYGNGYYEEGNRRGLRGKFRKKLNKN